MFASQIPNHQQVMCLACGAISARNPKQTTCNARLRYQKLCHGKLIEPLFIVFDNRNGGYVTDNPHYYTKLKERSRVFNRSDVNTYVATAYRAASWEACATRCSILPAVNL